MDQKANGISVLFGPLDGINQTADAKIPEIEVGFPQDRINENECQC